MEKCSETTNNYLNAFVAACYSAWYNRSWAVWKQTENGAYWYTILDDNGLPSEDNIIEGETGEKMYLDREDACEQWGENVGLISLDNGLTYKSVDDLSDDEITFVIQNIDNHQPQFFPEIAALCNELNGCYDTNRQWLEAFMSRLCEPYMIG